MAGAPVRMPYDAASALHVRPLTKEIMVDAGELNGGISDGLIRLHDRKSLYRGVEIKEQSPLGVFADHALNPKE